MRGKRSGPRRNAAAGDRGGCAPLRSRRHGHHDRGRDRVGRRQCRGRDVLDAAYDVCPRPGWTVALPLCEGPSPVSNAALVDRRFWAVRARTRGCRNLRLARGDERADSSAHLSRLHRGYASATSTIRCFPRVAAIAGWLHDTGDCRSTVYLAAAARDSGGGARDSRVAWVRFRAVRNATPRGASVPGPATSLVGPGPEKFLDLSRIEVLVRSRNHAVAHVTDEADVHLPNEIVWVRHVQRVLLHESAFERVYSPVLEPHLLQALHTVLQHREIGIARLIQTVVAVPDDCFRRVALLQRRVVLLLDRIEEPIAQHEQVPVLSHVLPSSATVRPDREPRHAGNLLESMYSSMRVILPSRHWPTMQIQSAPR